MPVPSSLTTTRLSREPINEQTGQDILTALGGTAGSISAGIGAKADTAATTDTGTFSLIALFKRLLAKITAFLTSDGAAVITVGAALPVRVTLAVSASPDYTAGDSIGGKIVLANAVRVAGGTSRIESLLITDKANQKPSGYILIFNADPTAATLTDNAAVVLSTDLTKVIARIDVSAADYVTIDSKAIAQVPYVGGPLKSAATTSLWACWVALSAPNLAAVDDIEMLFGFTAQN